MCGRELGSSSHWCPIFLLFVWTHPIGWSEND